MTLDEAITHCEEVAKEQKEAGCEGCASDHEQLAEWLKELKWRQQNSVNEIAKEAFDVAQKRAEKMQAEFPQDTMALLQHCADEVVEATIEFACFDLLQLDFFKKLYKEQFIGELADIIMCVLIIGASYGIDMESALLDCLKKNKERAGV